MGSFRSIRPATLTVLGALTFLVSACGGDDTTAQRTEPRSTTRTAPPVEAPARVDPEDERVVRTWADTLRRGDEQGASRYFAVPSRVANGDNPVRLRTRAAILEFQRSLPCGAELLDTEPAPQGFLIATFRLTDRPGGTCGSGSGNTARTAVRVRDERITDWLRIEDLPTGPTTEA